MKKFAPHLMFTLLFIGVISICISITGCTENERAKAWGGKMTIDLPINQKLVNVTWKETDLWVLTKPMDMLDKAETYKFTEKSTFGMMEGEITLVETKTSLIGK